MSRASLALTWERWGPALWPGAALTGLYVALALFGAWEALGDPWRALALAGAVGGGMAFAVFRIRGAARPSLSMAQRRVEEDSGFSGRPLESFEDEAALGDSALWRAHQTRMRAQLDQARTHGPRAAVAAADRYALRGAVLVLLILGVFAAGDRAGERIGAAFEPSLTVAGGPDAVIDAWLTPPAYTGAPPVYLTEAGSEERITAPKGSGFVLRASAARRAPAVTVRQNGETRRLEAARIDEGVYEAQTKIAANAEIRAGERVWRIRALPDDAPRAAFAEPPSGSDTGELRIPVAAVDDYGVSNVRLDMALASDPRRTDHAVLIEGDRGPASIETTHEIDLTSHRWAGKAVRLRLTAIDAAGQKGFSDWVTFTLPERAFVDPLAKAVVEQRSLLLNETRRYASLPPDAEGASDRQQKALGFVTDRPELAIGRAPASVQRAEAMLEAVTAEPEHYFSDYAVYLGLANAERQLEMGRSQDDIAGVPEQLWDIALRAELGDLADAEAAMEAAERALQEALARGAPMSELAQLFEAYQQAVQRYLQALARNAQATGEMAGGAAGQVMQNQDIQELMDAIREAAELGSNGDASQALQALSEMLENLQMQVAQARGGGQGEMDAQSKADIEALQELGEMIGDERSLMDETVREYGDEDAQSDQDAARQRALDQLLQRQQERRSGQGRSGEDGQPQPGGDDGEQTGAPQPGGSDEGSALARRQSEIGERLGALQDKLAGNGGAGEDGPPEALGRAGRAMQRAEETLGRGAGDEALEAQEDAIQALREGADALAERLAERQQRNGQEGAGGQAQTDPLGRPGQGGMGTGDNVQIPDKMERQRAREILEEIRRRAAERGRPQEELDYYDRLLERF